MDDNRAVRCADDDEESSGNMDYTSADNASEKKQRN